MKENDALETIPGVGKSIAKDLRSMGITTVGALQGKDPEVLYDDLCIKQQTKVDRCVLYVFRCACYYASNERHDAELLKWWNWKDQTDHETCT